VCSHLEGAELVHDRRQLVGCVDADFAGAGHPVRSRELGRIPRQVAVANPRLECAPERRHKRVAESLRKRKQLLESRRRPGTLPVRCQRRTVSGLTDTRSARVRVVRRRSVIADLP
jgi:hypothetical protein